MFLRICVCMYARRLVCIIVYVCMYVGMNERIYDYVSMHMCVKVFRMYVCIYVYV